MKEVVFSIEPCMGTGGFVARWDDPNGGGITTQGDNIGELHFMITDAVKAYFDEGKRPQTIRLHFVRDPVLAVA